MKSMSHRQTHKSNNDKQVSIELLSDELWFLLRQFGPAIALGMKNPHLGWLIEEIQEADRNALRSLVDREIIHIASKNQIELDNALATMLRTCAHPQHTLISQFQDATGANKQRYIHFGNNLIVEHVEFKRGQHRLTAIKDREALLEHLDEVLRPSSTASSHGGKFHMPEQTLFEARALCSQGHARKALNDLKKENLSEEKAASLTKTLTDPVANSAFAMLCNQGQPQIQNVKGFALLEGKNDFWILMPYDKDSHKMVEFIPASSKLVKQRFLEILP